MLVPLPVAAHSCAQGLKNTAVALAGTHSDCEQCSGLSRPPGNDPRCSGPSENLHPVAFRSQSRDQRHNQRRICRRPLCIGINPNNTSGRSGNISRRAEARVVRPKFPIAAKFDGRLSGERLLECRKLFWRNSAMCAVKRAHRSPRDVGTSLKVILLSNLLRARHILFK